MRQVSPWLTALVVLLSVWGAACNRSKKAEQLAALDRGLEAGLLTKDEYEAKKAIVLGAGQGPGAGAAEKQGPGTRGQGPGAAASVPTTPAPATPEPSTPAIATPAPAAHAPASQLNNSTRASSSGEEAEPAPLAGCKDTGTKPGKEKGKQERFFPMPMAKVKDAAIGALEALEFKVNSDSGREIDASKKRHVGVIGSGGEKMVLRFEEAAEGNQRGTRVIGETKKGFLGRAGQKSWTNAVLAQTGCMLRKGASGHAGQPRGH